MDDLAQTLFSAWSPSKNLIVDFTQVTFMDSTGVRWPFDTQLEVTGADREMRLIVPEGGQIDRLLDIAGADAIFTIYRNRDEAWETTGTGEDNAMSDRPRTQLGGLSDG